MAAIPLIIITIGSLIEDLLDAKQRNSSNNISKDPLVDMDSIKIKPIKGIGRFTVFASAFGILLILYCLFFSLAFKLERLPENEQEPISLVYYDNSNTTVKDSIMTTVDESNIYENNKFYETCIFKPNVSDLSIRVGNLKGFGYNWVVIIFVICFTVLSVFDIISSKITYSRISNNKGKH